MPTPATNASHPDFAEWDLGAFTTTPDILGLVPLAIFSGVLGVEVSLALLDMIGFFANLFHFQRLSVHLNVVLRQYLRSNRRAEPDWWRTDRRTDGSLRLRTDSRALVPEVIVRVLINRSEVQPRLAILRPISGEGTVLNGNLLRGIIQHCL